MNVQKNTLKITNYPQQIRRLVQKIFKIRRFAKKSESGNTGQD